MRDFAGHALVADSASFTEDDLVLAVLVEVRDMDRIEIGRGELVDGEARANGVSGEFTKQHWSAQEVEGDEFLRASARPVDRVDILQHRERQAARRREAAVAVAEQEPGAIAAAKNCKY